MSDSVDTICVHGVRNPTEQCNCCMNDLIAELRTEVATLDDEIFQRARALSAEALKRAEKAEAKIERIKPLFDLTRSQAQLATGEMSAQEWRTVSAVLNWLNTKLQAALKEQP